MKKKNLILQIQELNLEVKNNLECYNVLYKHLGKRKESKYLEMINSRHNSYFYLILNNHLQLAILTLRTLVEPKDLVKTKEISPYNKAMELTETQLKNLEKIKVEFYKKELHKFRHNAIAHKSDPNKIHSLKYSFISKNYIIFKSVKNIYNKFNKWMKKTLVDNDINELFSKTEEEIGLERIIKYFEKSLLIYRERLFEHMVKTTQK